MTIDNGWQGHFLEDFGVGDVYHHSLGRTVIEADNVWFTLLTQNTARPHFDEHYAANTAFARPLVNSCFTIALVTGQTVSDISFNVKANLGWDRVRLPHPVFVGDTIYSSSRVLSTRESNSHPDAGIVEVETQGYNQDGEIVISFTRVLLVYRRGFSPATDRPVPDFPERALSGSAGS